MTLRRTLVTIEVALAGLGLAVFAVLSYKLYSRSEYSHVDSQLRSARPALAGTLSHQASSSTSSCQTSSQAQSAGRPPDGDAGPGPGGLSGGPGNNLPAGSFIQLRDQNGKVLEQLGIAFLSGACPNPNLPAKLTAGSDPAGRAFTVSAKSGVGPFRVLVSPPLEAGGPQPLNPTQARGYVLVVAMPIDTVTHSLHLLLLLDVAVAGGVLVALSLATLVLVRRGLRPVERMATTAGAITAGDLSHRVSVNESRTEVGQLGTAFNTMLNRIEAAFAERDATEQRLRQFLADASHELRTPLTSIRGYAELWRIGAARDEAELAEVMGRIEEHAGRMGGLIEELLLLARLDEAGHTGPLAHEPVDLAVLAAEACDDAATLAPGRPITLDAPDAAAVTADAIHLRRAIGNLVTNAIRHTPDGTPVEVSVRSAGGVATLTVRDHGPGLSPEGLVHAFDRFWQADASRHSGGSGLGLAIVAGVAHEHGGTVTAANADDGGAVFAIRLPAVATPAVLT